jgi:predicted nucleotidyltransferase
VYYSTDASQEPIYSLSEGAFFSMATRVVERYNAFMVATRQQALEIAAKAREDLDRLYGKRLRGVYLYGSAARDQLTPDSDIDIAVVLDEIRSRFEEHELTGDLYSQISLQYNTVVTFLFITEPDFNEGVYTVYRVIKREGISV